MKIKSTSDGRRILESMKQRLKQKHMGLGVLDAYHPGAQKAFSRLLNGETAANDSNLASVAEAVCGLVKDPAKAGCSHLAQNLSEFWVIFCGDLRQLTQEKLSSESVDCERLTLTLRRAFNLYPKGRDVEIRETLLRSRLLKLGYKDPEIAGELALILDIMDDPDDRDIVLKLYERAVQQTKPSSSEHYRHFADFLDRKIGNKNRAKLLYREALDIEKKHPGNLGNYGEFLVGSGEPLEESIKEGANLLVEAFDIAKSNPNPQDDDKLAELCFALWLVLRTWPRLFRTWPQHKSSYQKYEKYFRFQIRKEFDRTYSWNFDNMLARAERELSSPEDSKYAKALADAFLDSDKVGELNQFPQWSALGKGSDPRKTNVGKSGRKSKNSH